MKKLHVNPTSGEVRTCKATFGCPFGASLADHFEDEGEARNFYEMLMASRWQINAEGFSARKARYDQLSEEYALSLTDEEVNTVSAYVNQDYERINSNLWAGRTPPEANILDGLLNERGDEKELYRRPPANLSLHSSNKKLRTNDTFVLKGYSSFTEEPASLLPLLSRGLGPKTAENNVVLVLNTSFGAPASSLSHMPQEREWLLPRELKLRVSSVTTRALESTYDILGNSVNEFRAITCVVLEED